MTFSIVAADRRAKEVGFAIASCCWDAGQVCMAKAEVGAIASQASGNIGFLPAFFAKLSADVGLRRVLNYFREIDEKIETRQIGMVRQDGEALAFTGDACSDWAGHRTGDGFSCQGNILVGPEVVDAMVEAFERADGALYRRLYAALRAGDDAGGDLRGKQSARLLVAKTGYGQPGTDTFLDVRIEDHREPVSEIGRILDVGGTLMHILGLLGEVGKADRRDRVRALDRLRAYLEDRRDCRFLDWWEDLGMGYYEIGEVEKAAAAFRVYVEINPAMEKLLRSSAAKGRFPGDLAERLGLVAA
jgi:uncharacterized Ntn-hydrolase superfamily protein